MKRLIVFVVLAWQFLVASSVLADSTPAARLSLKGINGIALQVEQINATAEKDGLSRQAIRREVETRLREAKVPVLMPDQQQQSLRRPCLVVRVATSKLNTGEHLYSIRVEVTQWVASLANPAVTVSQAIPVPATTWSAAGVFGITPPEQLKGDSHRAVAAMVDEFINAYYLANPSETAYRLRRPDKVR